MEDFGPEAKGKLDAQINFLERKNTALQEKLDAARAELDDARREAGDSDAQEDADSASDEPRDGSVNKLCREPALLKHSVLSELFSGRSNLKLLQSYMDELTEALDKGDAPEDSLEGAGEVITVLTTDSKDIAKGATRDGAILLSSLATELEGAK